jgi:hypothetical protein
VFTTIWFVGLAFNRTDSASRRDEYSIYAAQGKSASQ